MTPELAGLAAAGCVALGAVGVALVRSTPRGAERLVAERLAAGEQVSVLRQVRDGLGRRFGPRVQATMSESRVQTIRHRLDAAGRPDGLTLEDYAGQKAGNTALGLLSGLLLLLLGSPLLLLALTGAGWLAGDLRLARIAKARQARIEQDLPDFLDVLSVTVSAGLGFRNALERVADSLPGPVAEEVTTTLRQMSLGASRRAAFEGLRERNDSEGLEQLVTALLQAEELGAPLADALAGIATDMRQTFAQNARRRAARAAPRVSLIVAVVVLPGAAVLVIGGLLVSAAGDLRGVFGG